MLRRLLRRFAPRNDKKRTPRNDTFLAVLLISLVLLCPIVAYSIPADVRDISDTKYYDAVHESLGKAQESIYISLYGIIVSEHDKLSLPYLLVQDLIEAHKRGVKVVVRLDKSYDYRGSERTRELSDRNDEACLMLVEAGIDCKFVIQDKTLHDKLIVIDRKIIIEGSMNWSTSALRLNRESVTLIESEEYAKEKIGRIEGLKTIDKGDLDRAQVETVAVRNEFLRDAGLAGAMVHGRDETAFDMYLLFLKDFDKSGAKFELDYEKMGKWFGLDITKRRDYRNRINQALKRLKDKYRLIDCEFKINNPAEITLLDYEDRSKEYKAPEIKYFKVPLAYWEYGWSRKLDLRSKFCYLINIYRTEFSDIKPWWSLPLDLLAEDFNVDKWTVMRGMRELKKLGLLEVEYDEALNDKGVFSGNRKPNKYKIKPLLSQEEIDKEWKELENIYGVELVNKTRGFAIMIEEGNNTQKVEAFIQIIGRYSEAWVEKATIITTRMRADNPSRNFGYIVGILKRWEKQGHTD